MIVLFICWFGSFVFEGDGAEDVWGGRVGRGEGAGVWVWGVTLKHLCLLSEQEACHDLRRVI